MQPYRPKRAGRPFSSRPGSSGERALYADLAGAQPANAALSRIHFGAQPVVDGPDLVGKADRHRGAFAQALRSRRFKGQMLVAVERIEELLQASSEQYLLESRIGMRARKLRFAYQMIHGQPVERPDATLRNSFAAKGS
jgi:hypothetical protein